MNRMIGIILMILGAVSFVGGLLLFSGSGKSKGTLGGEGETFEENLEFKKSIDDSAEQTETQSDLTNFALEETNKIGVDNSDALGNAVEIAIADGILTNNEKN